MMRVSMNVAKLPFAFGLCAAAHVNMTIGAGSVFAATTGFFWTEKTDISARKAIAPREDTCGGIPEANARLHGFLKNHFKSNEL